MSTLKVPITSTDHIQGSSNASIQLVEYGDYQCPYCGEAYPIIKKIQKEFQNRLCFVFRNFPIVDSHPFAGIAALTAEYAATKDKFWEMHDMLYENQEFLDLPYLLEYAKSLHLSDTELQKAIENETFAKKIQDDFMGGVRSGVNGTPTFFINGYRHDGSFEYDELKEALENAKTKANVQS